MLRCIVLVPIFVVWFPLLAQVSESPGRKRALLVGVENYPPPRSRVPGLQDVALMKTMLIAHGFAAEDVRTLKDEEATESAFLAALDQLRKEAQPQDVVVVYFSGHGSQVPDLDGDEGEGPGGLDETLLLWDSDSGLLDDVFAQHLATFRSNHLVLILDACHAAGGLRGSSPKSHPVHALEDGTHPDSEPFFFDKPLFDLRRWVFIAATSRESRLAYHDGVRSHLTAALCQAMALPRSESFSYAQWAVHVQRDLYRRTQRASFHGATHLPVFGSGASISSQRVLVQLPQGTWGANGLAFPGWTTGGKVSLHRPSSDTKVGTTQAYGLAEIKTAFPTNAILELPPNVVPKPGDLVTLEKPGNAPKIRVRLQPPQRQGLTAKELDELHSVPMPWQSKVVPWQEASENPTHEIWRNDKGRLVISDAADRPLVALPADAGMATLAWALWLQALHWDLLQYQETSNRLQVHLLPVKAEAPFRQDAHAIWQVPSQRSFRIDVRLQAQETQSLAVFGFILSRNGSVFSLPHNETRPVIAPGETHRFYVPFKTGGAATFPETIVLFGVQPEAVSAWPSLAWTPAQPPQLSRGWFPEILTTLVGSGQRSELFTPITTWAFVKVLFQTTQELKP